MHSNDFFRTDAATTLCEHFIAAGVVCSLSTNSEQVLEAARATFVSAKTTANTVEIPMRFWADDDDTPDFPSLKPFVRGLGHLVFVGFASRSSLLADLRNRRVIGRFSRAMAADKTYWRTIIFPMLLSIVSGTVGMIELHASCVAKDGYGLILAGPSRSGKSTLALALTQRGFHLLSDDRTFCSLRQGELTAWGLPRPLKVRPEAAEWFDAFRGREPNAIQNGERVFHFEPKEHGARHCQPRMFVFLEQLREREFSIVGMKQDVARLRIEQELLAEAPAAIHQQIGPLERLLSLQPCLLRYGGAAAEIGDRLAESFASWQESRLAGGLWQAS